MRKQAPPGASAAASPAAFEAALVADIRQIILDARQKVARAVDSGLVLMNWSIGTRIRKDILKERRAEYGQQILQSLSAKLTEEFGRGYGARNLANMVRFAEVFPDPQILPSLIAKLSWTHFTHLIYLDDPLKREFYAEMCRIEGWNTRTLQDKVDSMLYERTAISKKREALIRQELKALRAEDRMTPDLVFRDPCILDFLGLKNTYAERDLETAILREMESFILELGTGFAFVARQKRMTIDNEDHSLDLLFYHRSLRRLVAIELKLGEFKAAYKGQMEMYLAWLNRYERGKGEEKPIGVLLCAGKKQETIELLDMEKDDIGVSSYWTEILPKDQLRKKLHDAVLLARARIHARADDQGAPAHPPPTGRQGGPAPTHQQGQFLAYIREYMIRNEAGLAPTHAVLQRFFDLTPPSVNSMLKRLEQRGFIRRLPGVARGIELLVGPDQIPPLNEHFRA